MLPRNPLFLRETELDRSLELMMLASRHVLRSGAALLEERGLATVDFEILYLVHRHPGIAAPELGLVLGMAKQSLSRHVRRLTGMGLLRQQAVRGDRRRKALVVGEGAIPVIAAVCASHRRGLRQAFNGAGPEAVAGFQRVLGELLDTSGRRLLARQSG
jgi:DNA-binding MarR family transcriptional regulator